MPHYVVWTRPSVEFAVVDRLRDKGFDAFCPAINKLMLVGGSRRYWRGKERHEVIRLPAFHRYAFFAPSEAAPHWQVANKVDGVTAVLRPAGQPDDDPWIVPEPVLLMLRGPAGDGTIADETSLLRGLEHYADRTPVRVTSGSLISHAGIVVGDDGRKVKILMSVLGRETTVTLPRQIVSPIPV